jgi:superfamily II DNA or RNA helicase
MSDEIKIRDLLECLWDLVGAEAVSRLSDKRGTGGRGRAGKCEALARSYRGDHDAFFADLRKSDLVALLQDPTEIDGVDYVLPRASTYDKAELEAIAFDAFCAGGVPDEFEPIEDDDDDDGDDFEGDDFEGDDSIDDDGGDDDEESPRTDAYAARMLADFRPLPAPPQPRPYQRDALRAVTEQLRPGARPLLHVATGGGKTLIANDLVATLVRERGQRVLWVTKDWRLLYQAAGDLSRRHRMGPYLSRLGGNGRTLHPLPETRAAVQYTTIQTLSRRLGQRALEGVGLIVWDECHWGEHGKSGRRVLKALGHIPVLGLTATPRPPASSTFRIAYTKTFWELVREGYLAEPKIHEPIRTGISWNPARAGSEGDFRKGSLIELAENARRNKLIVEHYVANAATFGQTILFACGKEHANTLAEMLARRGIAARAIHSDNDESENHVHLEAFRSHRVTVATNVEMLTHGIDVPSARTVLLTRPTLSDVLYSQMIGRASRLDPDTGKRTFHVVEFTDNLERFADDLRTAKTFFAGAGAGPTVAPASVSPPQIARPIHVATTGEHRYDPGGAPTWIPDVGDLPEAVRGLWYRKGQTFGFEIEVTQPGIDPATLRGTAHWMGVAEALREALARRLPGRVASHVYPEYEGIGGAKSYAVWNVEYDASVGWEVTSRVLTDEAGYLEVVDATDAIDEVVAGRGLHVNFRTGLHLHLAWTFQTTEELRRFVQLVRVFEPGLASLVSASRIAQYSDGRYHIGTPNRYCRPISTVIPGADLHAAAANLRQLITKRLNADGARFTTVNLSPLMLEGGSGTVEIRMHSGTVEARKMLLWLSLWQQILWAAGSNAVVPDVPDRAYLEPDADVIALARTYLPAAGQPPQQVFLRKLANRREEVVSSWAGHSELSRWVANAAHWIF